MILRIITTAVIFATGLTACKNPGHPEKEALRPDSTLTPKTGTMNNLISIVEIPVIDFARAVRFYQNITGITIEETEMDGVKLGVLPNDEGTVNVVLAKGDDYQPTTGGALLYLNAGRDLQPMLNKVEQSGGQVIVPKTMISSEMGSLLYLQIQKEIS